MEQAVAATFRIYISRIISGALWATDKKYRPTTNKFCRGYIWMRSIVLTTPGKKGKVVPLQALGGLEGGWSAPHHGHFTPGKDPVPIVQEAGWASGPVWMCVKNLASHRDSIPEPSSP
jgi:hypothetical protein